MPIRYDGVLARSLPPLARLRIASFRHPYAVIWVGRHGGFIWIWGRAAGRVSFWERGRPGPLGRDAAACPCGARVEWQTAGCQGPQPFSLFEEAGLPNAWK